MKHTAAAAMAIAIASPAEAQERSSVAPKAMQEIAPGLADYTDKVLFGDVWVRPELSPRDRSLVTLSVLIATGKTAQLGGHISRALANGIKPVEVAGMVTQLAFYTGWPNAVSALTVIEQLFAERKIDTAPLRLNAGPPVALPASESARAAWVQERIAPVAPKLAQLTDAVLFGDLWRRADLTPRDRSLVTISALAANGDVDQLPFHLRRGLENGLTRQEIGEAFTHLAFYAGWSKATAAVDAAAKLFGEAGGGRPVSEPRLRIVPSNQSPTPGPASNFTGTAIISSVFRGTEDARLGGATVTFQPGARTNWHRHPLGQLLVVTAGRGWAQAEREPVQAIRAGDTIWIGPGVKHWHGATRTSALTHVAVAEAIDGKSVIWLEPVGDEQYEGPL